MGPKRASAANHYATRTQLPAVFTKTHCPRSPSQWPQLLHGVGAPHDIERGGYFGDTAAIDDVVTEEPDVGSRAVGRAQGTYMLASQHEEVFVVAVTVALTAGPYNGSTFSVAGRVGVYNDKAEAAVVGGTGRLRRAGGYLTWRMVKLVVSEGYVRWSWTCTWPCR
ncbi:dirigent protein 19-like [Panicum miliaceum]|uniref:Dirigent protein n=1 Tax=Panicum miliaceum TaxID=4540 RepID=A0A3L6TKJ6_PANMI|nr:dirigent protein 19-like [Panicum miliaceum]